MQRVDFSAFVWLEVNHLLGLALTLTVSACTPSRRADPPAQASSDASGVQVTTDRSGYRAGDPLTLTVHNGSADTVAFNPCTRMLEREQSGSWSAVPEPQRICTMEAWILTPGQRRTGPTELPADLAAGRYRAVLAFTAESPDPSAKRTEARTTPFTVER